MHTATRYLVRVVLIGAAALCVNASCARAESIEGKYFSVTLSEGTDKLQLLEKLQARYFGQLDTIIQDTKGSADNNIVIGGLLDALYLEVCDILDIHLYSLKIDLEVVADKQQLAAILGNYFKNPPDTPSFYFYEKNRIYISFQDMTLGMLAHEISHAIITHYFVVPPPEKVQEVLSGYVEYAISKSPG